MGWPGRRIVLFMTVRRGLSGPRRTSMTAPMRIPYTALYIALTAFVNWAFVVVDPIRLPGGVIWWADEEIDRFDDLLEERVTYAFSEEFGYLTACPTNVGCGIRISV